VYLPQENAKTPSEQRPEGVRNRVFRKTARRTPSDPPRKQGFLGSKTAKSWYLRRKEISTRKQGQKPRKPRKGDERRLKASIGDESHSVLSKNLVENPKSARKPPRKPPETPKTPVLTPPDPRKWGFWGRSNVRRVYAGTPPILGVFGGVLGGFWGVKSDSRRIGTCERGVFAGFRDLCVSGYP